MSEVKTENNGAPYPLLAAIGTGSAGIVSSGSQKTLSHGNLFQVQNYHGIETVINHKASAVMAACGYIKSRLSSGPVRVVST